MRGGITLWKYDKSQQPQCLSFHSPFFYNNHYDRRTSIAKKIKDSTCKNGVLYVATWGSYSVYKIDLNQEKPQFKELFTWNKITNGYSSFKLRCTPNGLLIIEYIDSILNKNWDNEGSVLISIKEITVSDDGKVNFLKDKHLGIQRVTHVLDGVPNNWILVSKYCNTSSGSVSGLIIYDSESLTEWIGEDMGLKPPVLSSDRYFFMGDFLCLTYFPNFVRIIHLPTKKDYTEKLAPFLRLNGQEAVLCGLHLETKNTGDILHVLWEVKEPAKDAASDDTFVLKSSRIELGAVSKCNYAKILITVAGVLAFITLIAAIPLAFTHTGTVLVETHGFVLTVPTVVTLIVGETTALVFVCVGIYLKKRKSNV